MLLNRLEPSPADATHAARLPGAGAAGRALRIGGHLRARGARGGLALIDQGLYAGAHFLLNILLARWLSPAAYGTFALLYSAFLLAGTVYSAALLEPMTVFGAGKYRLRRAAHLGVLLRAHLLVSAALSAFVIAGWLIAWQRGFAGATDGVVLGLLTPLMMLPWLTRRAFYLELRPARAAAGNAVYFVVLLATASALFSHRALSVQAAIITIALASTVAAAVQIMWLRPQWRLDGSVSAGELAAEHWKYGRWALASAAAVWFPLNIYYYTLPLSAGLEAAGALRALLNLANPMLHSLAALGLLLTPALVRARDDGGVVQVHRTVRRLLLACGAASALYLIPLWLLRVEVLHLLYGGRYASLSATHVALAGLLPLTSAATTILGSALRALERPRQIFFCNMVFALVGGLVGLPLALKWGLSGALTGMLASYAALALALLVPYVAALSAARDGRRRCLVQE